MRGQRRRPSPSRRQAAAVAQAVAARLPSYRRPRSGSCCAQLQRAYPAQRARVPAVGQPAQVAAQESAPLLH